MSTDVERAKRMLFHCNLRIENLRDELAMTQNALHEALKLQRELTKQVDKGGDHVSLAD